MARIEDQSVVLPDLRMDGSGLPRRAANAPDLGNVGIPECCGGLFPSQHSEALVSCVNNPSKHLRDNEFVWGTEL